MNKLYSILIMYFYFSSSALAVSRPTQFVLLAFDGSKNLDMWNETRLFANRTGGVAFTYFVSGVYFFTKETRSEYYTAPKRTYGASAIGYSNTAEGIPIRLEQLIRAQREGHEIASHANAHFNGQTENWSHNDWMSEFRQFDSILNRAFSQHNFRRRKSNKILNNVVGFRAPQLGVNSGLWSTLNQYSYGKYRYDTSRVSQIGYWPKKQNGRNFWNFPLVSMRLANSGRNTLSMDYNHKVSHARYNELHPSAALSVRAMEEDVYKTYMAYFNAGYYGNRAPVHIGHHFSKWNSGAYWNAMKRFAESVCHKREVKCGTYTELSDYMDKLKKSGDLDEVYSGDFSRLRGIETAYMDFDISSLSKEDYDFLFGKKVNIKIDIKPSDASGIFSREELINMGFDLNHHESH